VMATFHVTQYDCVARFGLRNAVQTRRKV
jgi:hypothetical protein